MQSIALLVAAGTDGAYSLLFRELIDDLDFFPAIPSGQVPQLSYFPSERVVMGYDVEKTDEQWRSELSPESYAILRHAATEPAWTGELLEEKRAGLYTCKGCGNELFRAGTKFDSGCGWPSFYEAIKPEAVILRDDNSLGMQRTEVLCSKCGGHLGHVFPDGFGTPTGDRYCMNSLSLNFTPET